MRQSLTAALLSMALVLAGCGKDDPEVAGKDPDEPLTSPVTGLEVDELPANPAFVVKIENTASGRPQYGLNQADMVVEQLVEGGVTRLAAIYYSKLPEKIGHVRSARGTDIGIAAPLKGVIVASGAARATSAKINSAGLPFLSEDAGAPGFSSDPAKARPYNRMLNLATLAKDKKAPSTMNPYFAWKAGAQAAGKPVSSVTVKFSGQTSTTFQYANGAWVRANSGAATGQDFSSKNLVVIFAPVADAGYRDPGGNAVPETTFSGTGKALVVQGNKALDVTWKKSSARSTLRFTDAAGKAISMEPGTTWIALAPQGAGSVSSN